MCYLVHINENRIHLLASLCRQSQRQVMVYRSEDLSLLNTVTLDESPAIVIPHYDADSNTLFLSGKGESTVCQIFSLHMKPFSTRFFPMCDLGDDVRGCV